MGLVVGRKPGESIVIGDDIVVTVVEFRSGGVRIHIEAPKDVSVHRQEVYDEIQKAWRHTDGDSSHGRLEP